jgi:hypothetical protein
MVTLDESSVKANTSIVAKQNQQASALRQIMDFTDVSSSRANQLIKKWETLERSKQQFVFDTGGMSISGYTGLLQNDKSKLIDQYDTILAKEGRLTALMEAQKEAGNQEEYLKYQEEIAKNDNQRYDILQQIFDIEKAIYNLPSQTWAQAFGKQLSSINVELNKAQDTIAGMIVDSAREAGKGILNEMLYGTTAKSIDSQLDDLKFQLQQIQAEKQYELTGVKSITLVEDQEANTLAKINQLEKERSEIILNLLSNIAQKAVSKMEDMFIDSALSYIMKGFGVSTPSIGSGSKSGGWSDTSGNPTANYSAPITSSTSSNKSVIMQFNAPVYGGDTFMNQVKQSIISINKGFV